MTIAGGQRRAKQWHGVPRKGKSGALKEGRKLGANSARSTAARPS